MVKDDDGEENEIKAAVEVSLSESSNSSGNLLRLNTLVVPSKLLTLVPNILSPIRLYPVGLRRQPQVRPGFIAHLRTLGTTVKTRC